MKIEKFRKLVPPFETSDLAFAAALMCAGETMMGTVANDYNPNQSIFQFEASSRIEDRREEFINKKLMVEPNEFMQHIRNLKGSLRY